MKSEYSITQKLSLTASQEDVDGERYHIMSEAVLQRDVELDVSRVVPQADATLRCQALGNGDVGII